MNILNKTKSMLLFSLSLLALLALVAAPYAFAQEEAMDDGAMQEGMQAKMEQRHQMMMERHQKMVEEMEAEMAGLDALVAEMNAADGHGAKIDAIAAVVEELVARHNQHMTQRLEMMEAMGGGMGDMPKGHPAMEGHGGHHEMKGHHGDASCSHCKSGDCPHKEGMSCDQCKEGGDCPHAMEGGECPHCKSGDCPHKADGKCPHAKAGGECKHHGGDCPMKDKTMEQDEAAMASEGR